jgi:hypothetical protein
MRDHDDDDGAKCDALLWRWRMRRTLCSRALDWMVPNSASTHAVHTTAALADAQDGGCAA